MRVRSGLFEKRGRNKKNVLIGAGIGAGVGAIGGGIYGDYLAQKEIENVPVKSVTLSWKEPVYQDKVIGYIPEDYYEPSTSWGWGWGHNVKPTKPVVRPVPLKDADGNVVYHNVTKTFTDHGNPVVHWETKEVKEPIFKGWNEETIADTDTYSYVDEDGNVHTYEEIDGYWHRFYPKISYKTIDTYQAPRVEFEHGVNVMGKVLTYAAIGAVIGGVTGGVIAALVEATKD